MRRRGHRRTAEIRGPSPALVAIWARREKRCKIRLFRESRDRPAARGVSCKLCIRVCKNRYASKSLYAIRLFRARRCCVVEGVCIEAHGPCSQARCLQAQRRRDRWRGCGAAKPENESYPLNMMIRASASGAMTSPIETPWNISTSHSGSRFCQVFLTRRTMTPRNATRARYPK